MLFSNLLADPSIPVKLIWLVVIKDNPEIKKIDGEPGGRAWKHTSDMRRRDERG